MGRARTVGLGDGFDDVPLLRRVDLPVVVAGNSPERSAPLLGSVPRAVVTRTTGPAGWAEKIIDILTQGTVGGSDAIQGAE